jgi:hypothetical protein
MGFHQVTIASRLPIDPIMQWGADGGGATHKEPSQATSAGSMKPKPQTQMSLKHETKASNMKPKPQTQ